MLCTTEVASEQGLRCSGAEANDHLGLQGSDFSVEPRPASGDFGSAWLFVNAAFAARLPFKMFDGVCDVGFFAVDAGFLQGAV